VRGFLDRRIVDIVPAHGSTAVLKKPIHSRQMKNMSAIWSYCISCQEDQLTSPVINLEQTILVHGCLAAAGLVVRCVTYFEPIMYQIQQNYDA
jgi:hypothetical protein